MTAQNVNKDEAINEVWMFELFTIGDLRQHQRHFQIKISKLGRIGVFGMMWKSNEMKMNEHSLQTWGIFTFRYSLIEIDRPKLGLLIDISPCLAFSIRYLQSMIKRREKRPKRRELKVHSKSPQAQDRFYKHWYANPSFVFDSFFFQELFGTTVYWAKWRLQGTQWVALRAGEILQELIRKLILGFWSAGLVVITDYWIRSGDRKVYCKSPQA